MDKESKNTLVVLLSTLLFSAIYGIVLYAIVSVIKDFISITPTMLLLLVSSLIIAVAFFWYLHKDKYKDKITDATALFTFFSGLTLFLVASSLK